MSPDSLMSRRSRHQQEQQQQQQQESPFRRARLGNSQDIYSRHASSMSSPSPKQSTRLRREFSQTRTLAGAFEAAASRVATASLSDGDDDYADEDHSRQLYAVLSSTLSPRRRRERGGQSEPPSELVETYRHINDAVTLADLVEQEDLRLSVQGNRQLSPSAAARQRRQQQDYLRERRNFSPEHDVYRFGRHPMEEAASETNRRKTADYARDEQRLKSAMSSHTPVFSRARLGGVADRTRARTALSAETLQRRDAEMLAQDALLPESRDLEPSLNLPRAWGSRGRSRDWMRSVARQETGATRDESDAAEQRPLSSAAETRDPDTRLQPAQRSSPGRRAEADREAHLDRWPGPKALQTTGEGPASDRPAGAGAGSSNEQLTAPDGPSLLKRESKEHFQQSSRPADPVSQLQTPASQRASERAIYDKTPVVTGAWVDTPMTERVSGAEPEPEPKPGIDRASSVQQADAENTPLGITNETPEKDRRAVEPVKKIELAKPSLPRSALETVMEDVKLDRNALDVGDDTLESLELLLQEPANDDAAYEQAVIAKLASASASASAPVSVPSTEQAKVVDLQGKLIDQGMAIDQSKEAVDLGRLNGKLQSLVHNINEVKKGLNSLEQQVSHDATALSAPAQHKQRGWAHRTSSSSSSSSSSLSSAESCQCILCSAHGLLRLARLWRRHGSSSSSSSSTQRHLPQPTALGWLALAAITWVLAESTMCDYYCHPQVADACRGNCLLPNAPRFPYVIPTMLWRWSRLSAVLGPLLVVLGGVWRLVAQLFGFWDGFVDEYAVVSSASTSAAAAAAAAASAAAGSLSGHIRIHGDLVSGLPGFAAGPVVTGKTAPVVTLRQDAGADDSEAVSIEDDEYL